MGMGIGGLGIGVWGLTTNGEGTGEWGVEKGDFDHEWARISTNGEGTGEWRLGGWGGGFVGAELSDYGD